MIQLHSGCPGVRLLVVEDEKKVACFIKKYLEEEGFSVDVALDGETGIRLAMAEAHDVIILDFRLPQMSGIEVVGALAAMARRRPYCFYPPIPPSRK